MPANKIIVAVFFFFTTFAFAQTERPPDTYPKFSGPGDFTEYVANNFRGGQELFDKYGICQPVYITFTVTEKGTVENTKIFIDPQYPNNMPEAAEEALRLIKETSGKWKPATIKKKPVSHEMTKAVRYCLSIGK